MLSVGDIARIKAKNEIDFSWLQMNELNSKFRSVEDIADRYCTVVDIDENNNTISAMLDDGREVHLPLSSFVGLLSEESIDSKNNFQEEEILRTSDVVKNFAAQCIQTAFRRYRDCKSAIRIRKISSTQRLVMEMAADTIKNGLRKRYCCHEK